MIYDKPGLNIGEITLIGTGGGYGEACVIHLGNDAWAVIDSCQNPVTKSNLAIEYLTQCQVSLEAVELIICTHWHDDHILGIGQMLEKCQNAKFAFAKANDLAKFLHFVMLDFAKLKKQPSSVSTREFHHCLEILKKRNAHPIWAGQDTTLISKQLDAQYRSEIIALSPSHLTMTKFDGEISQLITDFGESRMKAVVNSPNSKSVAVFVKLGVHRAILGSDLEVSTDKYEGWDNVLLNCQTIDQRSSLFKIPHHGSVNGYHSGIWNKLLIANPVSKMTPWNRNKKLPQKDMVRKYLEHTDQLYITSSETKIRPKNRPSRVEKLLRQLNDTVTEIKFHQGMVRSRIDITDTSSKWKTDISAAALKLSIA